MHLLYLVIWIFSMNQEVERPLREVLNCYVSSSLSHPKLISGIICEESWTYQAFIP